MNSLRPLGARSSLLSHSFPAFYACYLLKSIQTPQSTAIYIGSTPSPPRRIRQHNGELTQGARRTRSKRPWVMQMIVHGFPSRLAALQFEWAWQNPHKSRHLRDANGSMFGTRASKILKKNIIIVRAMISKHPFNTWPLHVKLFTEEAVRHWNAAAGDDALPLPPGFTCTVELEGVDGKSGHPGSGRQGPISVDDSEFTSSLLAKNTALLASGHSLDCSICHQTIENYSTDPLKSALCPSSECVAVSHLDCLSRSFLNEQPDATPMIPRGGHCKSCGNYTLWGDIVRGCYRRMPSVDQHPDVATDDMFLSDEVDNENDTPLKQKPVRRKGSASPSKRHRTTKGKEKAINTPQSSDGESFDFTNIVSSSESGDGTTPMKRTPGRPRKNAGAASPALLSPIISPRPEGEDILPMKRTPGRPRKSASLSRTGARKRSLSPPTVTSRPEDKGILSTKLKPGRPRKVSPAALSPTRGRKKSPSPLTVASGSDGDHIKRKPGRPRKSSPVAISPALARKNSLSPSTALRLDGEDMFSTKRKPGRPSNSPPVTLSPTSPLGTRNKKVVPLPSKVRKLKGKSSSSEGEFFDFDNIVSSSENEDFMPLKGTAGQPRKDVGLPFASFSSPTISPKATQRKVITPSSEAGTLKSKKGKEKAVTVDPAGREDEGFVLRKIISSPGNENDHADDVAPTKRKPGQPRKSVVQPGLGTAKTLKGQGGQRHGQRQHYSTFATGTAYLDDDTTSGESFPFSQIIDSDSSEDDLERAMSALSISTLSRTVHPDRARHDKDNVVIVLSDFI